MPEPTKNRVKPPIDSPDEAVRKGSQGTPGFFYKPLEIKARESGLEDERKIVHMLRSFTLFHGSQIDGIPPYVAPGVEEAPWREVDAIAIIARNSKAVIRIGGDRAFYSPGLDFVQMPPTSAINWLVGCWAS